MVPVIVKRPDGLPHQAAMSDSRFVVVASSWNTSSRKVVFTMAASIRSEGVVITSPVVGSQLLYLLQLRRCYNVLLKSFAAGPADPHAIDSVWSLKSCSTTSSRDFLQTRRSCGSWYALAWIDKGDMALCEVAIHSLEDREASCSTYQYPISLLVSNENITSIK
jgi:hypothetical protein